MPPVPSDATDTGTTRRERRYARGKAISLYRDKYRVESARLAGWDYATPGWYFVTVCTRGRTRFFGRVVRRRMRLSRIGEVAYRYWEDIPNHCANAGLDAFVIMPDHVHGIIRITTPRTEHHHPRRDVARRDVACNVSTTARFPTIGGGSGAATVSPGRGSLGAIVRSYKAAVTRWCRTNGHADFAWQPRFYDRIIRDDAALRNIRRYILHNPARWGSAETGV